MAPQNLTEALDNLYTTTWANMKSEVADNIFDATPFWFWMKDNNRLTTTEGGKYLMEPLRYAKSDRVAFIGRGGTVSLNDSEFLTEARYDWRYLVDSVVRFNTDDQQNRGKNQIINLMQSKLDNSHDSLIDKIETVLFDTVTTDSLQFLGLQDLVDETPATGSVGDIDPAVYTWWQNQATNMTGESFGVYGVARMRTMMNNCMNNLKSDKPDILAMGQVPYEYYEDSQYEKMVVNNTKLAEAGFDSQTFKKVPMVWSPSCADTRMYFLNTNFLNFTYDPAMFFDMTEWKPIPDQVNDRVAQIITAGQMKMSRRRCQGVIYNIDTA